MSRLSSGELSRSGLVDDTRHETKVSKRTKWIRCKDAVERYSIGRTKITELALEAGAYLKIDRTVLIDMDTLDRFIETFRCRGSI